MQNEMRTDPQIAEADTVHEDTERPELRTVRISVRRLVEFILRTGDLDRRAQRGSDLEAALAGARLHRRIQKSSGSGYEAEVSLAEEVCFEDLIIRVEGRADGIVDGRMIDEIKGMFLNVSQLEEPFPLHLAQAKCYAAMYVREHDMDGMSVRITYADLNEREGKETLKQFSLEYSSEELREWFRELVSEYYRFAGWQEQHRRHRDQTIGALEFPFAFREGQRQLTAAVYRAVSRGEDLFFMAPTGVGKTMSSVFPAVRSMGEGKGDRIFYLTARNETMRAGQEAFSILQSRGLDCRTIRITSREKICPMHEPSCTPEDCPYARGHFDRVNEAVLDILDKTPFIDREQLLKQAEEWKVCPFELSLDIASWCDAILCDYNYVFDPDARLKRFFGQGVTGDYIFLIDEAHNLVERGRAMYSADLVKEHLLSAKRAASQAGEKGIARACDRVNRELLAMKHETEDKPSGSAMREPYRVWEFHELEKILKLTLGLYGELQRFFQEESGGGLKDRLLDFYFEVRTFVACSGVLNEHYLVYSELREKEFHLHLFCADPSERLSECSGRGRSTVYFSATLLPIAFYKNMLTDNEEAKAVYAPSPFDRSHRLLLRSEDVSTRYAVRGKDMYRRIADYIAVTAEAETGNYMVFFPSYKMQRDVFDVFRENYGDADIDWVLQRGGMQDEEREIFLENFYERPKRSLVGFCVMGGMFSEGLDLVGERLIGAIVVGAGLPQVSCERELLKQHFGNNGFDYAYRFPGINKVEQAAGRVIRTSEDRGVILLLDDRLGGWDYRQYFPREWSDCRVCSIGSLRGELENFWGSRRKDGGAIH